MNLLHKLQDLLDTTRALDWIAPLALRLYLVPVFWVAGNNKLSGFDNVVEWFGNVDYGLGLPFPYLMASLATGTEVIGALLLLVGLAVRWISIPLMFTMVIAATTAHWNNGWQAIADRSSPFPPIDVDGAVQRLDKAKDLLKEHGNYDWLTETGNFVILNNGVEWAATYFLMLLPLLFIGGGSYVSLDYWIRRKFGRDT
jgi:putative oxidoreductase